MAAQVLSFFQRSPRVVRVSADWSQQELAEFYRVESALIRAGIRVGTDRGLSDENEPWFVFFRADDGEVVIHFARIDGEYIIAGPAYEEIARGLDFSALVRNMVARHPLIQRSERGGNISIHPAALLVAVVGTAFFKTGEARAAESGGSNGAAAHARPAAAPASASTSASAPAALASGAAPAAVYDIAQIPANQAVLILAAALFASEYRSNVTAAARIIPEAVVAQPASVVNFAQASATLGASAKPLFGAIGHDAILDAAPQQTMTSVLSVLALLSTTPSASDIGADRSNAIQPVETTRGAATAAAPERGAEAAAQWTIEIHLSWLDVVNVEAVQLVRSAVGDLPRQTISVIQVDKLPSILSNIIERGPAYTVGTPPEHDPVADHSTPPATSTPQPPPAAGGSGQDTPAGDPQPGQSSGHDSESIGGGSGGGGDGGDGGGTNGAHNASPAPVIDTKPQLPQFSGFASPDLVRQFIDYFVAHTANVAMVNKGLQLVIYDARVLQHPEAMADVTSMTFNFFDGSSVNLVGEHTSFLHDPGLT